MDLLARHYGRSHFGLTYHEVLSLPIRLQTKMLEQLHEWRAREDREAKG